MSIQQPIVLVTGASGNVGSEVIKLLQSQNIPYRAPSRREFDFSDSRTFASALSQVERIFLVRPPELSDPKLFEPFLKAAQGVGVRQIVFLSLLGAEKNRFVPHRKIEDLIRSLAIGHTFLRPSFFMQNLSTTHAPEIRNLNEIIVPAGEGKTSFIDVRDIAAVAVKTLTDSIEKHLGQAYDLTGYEALSYTEVAHILSRLLGREILYRQPSIFRFIRVMRSRKLAWTYIGVMVAIYTVARMGKAGIITHEVQTLLGRTPIRFEQYAKDFSAAWRVPHS